VERQEGVLRRLLRVLRVAQNAEGERKDPGVITAHHLLKGLLVPGLDAADQLEITRDYFINHYYLCRRDIGRFIPFEESLRVESSGLRVLGQAPVLELSTLNPQPSTLNCIPWRRGGDSNPRYLLGTHAFQACSLSHSD